MTESNYKSCALCGSTAPSTTATCPNDGEASWIENAPTYVPEPELGTEPAALPSKKKAK